MYFAIRRRHKGNSEVKELCEAELPMYAAEN